MKYSDLSPWIVLSLVRFQRLHIFIMWHLSNDLMFRNISLKDQDSRFIFLLLAQCGRKHISTHIVLK